MQKTTALFGFLTYYLFTCYANAFPFQAEIKSICFSPEENRQEQDTDSCLKTINKYIDNAKEYVLIAVYSLTNQDIVHKIIEKKTSSPDTNFLILVDEKQAATNPDYFIKKVINPLFNARIAVYKANTNTKGLFHQKLLMSDWQGDDGIVATGSYNFSTNAEKNNSENLIFMQSMEASSYYVNIFINQMKENIKNSYLAACLKKIKAHQEELLSSLDEIMYGLKEPNLSVASKTLTTARRKKRKRDTVDSKKMVQGTHELKSCIKRLKAVCIKAEEDIDSTINMRSFLSKFKTISANLKDSDFDSIDSDFIRKIEKQTGFTPIVPNVNFPPKED